jgi:deoxyribonuclease-4
LQAERPGYRLKLLFETTAGQGSTVGYCFEHLASLFEQLDEPDRAAVCVDTCHLFAAGYDLRTPEAWAETFQQFETQVGCHRIAAFHVNDCKKPLGSRVDRHEAIGQGHIGLEGFRCLMQDSRFVDTPKILETPGGPDAYAQEIKLLASLTQSVGVNTGSL